MEGPTNKPQLLSVIAIHLNDWPLWWSELSFFDRTVPIAFVLGYWMTLNYLKGFRSDHLAMGLYILVTSYGGRFARILLRFGAPFLGVGIIYDSQRYYSEYLRGAIHISEPYRFDKYFFGIHTTQGVLTPNEWWQLHTFPILDVITGFAYLSFVVSFIVVSAYFYFVLTRKGTAKFSPAEITQRVPALIWSFFWVNMLGYTTYYWYAAAPPWYVARYGFGPPRMDVIASSAGCLRFDKILGTHLFTEMYGRATDVFGAVPSLHVAYPLVIIFFAFQMGAFRVGAVLLYLLMCFSAVYLNHHYILDILWGSVYAVIVAWTVSRYYFRQTRSIKSKQKS